MMRYVAFLILLLLSMPANAESEAVADIAEDFIPVTQDFDGAHMTVFGALQSKRSDIVVVFEGPPAKALVRAKEKQFGIWVNGEAETLEPVTSFYAVLTSKPLKEVAEEAELTKLGIGLKSMNLDGNAAKGFMDSRIIKGLYYEYENSIKIRDNRLFRADVILPPNVPVGSYKAKIFEFQKGNLKASRETSFKIAQVGLGSQIRRLALQSPALYATLSILLVLLIGGTAAHAFRKVS